MEERPQFCCARMRENVEDEIICYDLKFDEYGIPIQEDGLSVMLITYCPWCAKKLPESKRNAWFDALENMGIDPWEQEDAIPPAFLTDEWRRQ